MPFLRKIPASFAIQTGEYCGEIEVYAMVMVADCAAAALAALNPIRKRITSRIQLPRACTELREPSRLRFVERLAQGASEDRAQYFLFVSRRAAQIFDGLGVLLNQPARFVDQFRR